MIVKAVKAENCRDDYTVEFVNSEFNRLSKKEISDDQLISTLSFALSDKFSILTAITNLIKQNDENGLIFYSEQCSQWKKFLAKKSEDGLITITIQDYCEEANNRQYHKDGLTGLYDRTVFYRNLEKLLEKAEQEKLTFGLLLIDLDNVKDINSSLGYQGGDEILKKTSNLLLKLEKNDIKSYRYGDDEFMVVIQNADSLDSVVNTADTIYEMFMMEEISVSGGLSVYPDHSTSREDLLHFADTAVNHSKKHGKNVFTVFTYDMQKSFIQKLILQRHLTNAVLESSFQLYFQPQFNIKEGTLRGFEALIRWHDEELGNISPSIFIPLAEECSLILPIGTWVLTKAFATLKKWQQDYNFDGIISVNISPVQMKQSNFLFDLYDLIEKYDVKPENIEIEVTEGIMIDNMEDIVSKLTQMKNMGLKISLDDFGTGYSSLSYLQKLPLNTLKIDKSFIDDITKQDGKQAGITNSIINMVSSLGLETIAEGVEQDEQLMILEKFDCSIVQGYLRGKPMPESNCDRYLAGDKSALLKL